MYCTVEYLGCRLDSNLSGESMVLKILKKVNAKVKFVYRQNKYLIPRLKRLMRNALIQTHFIMVEHHDFSSAIKSESQVLEYKANLNVFIWTYPWCDIGAA